jgi:hypothetical protein
MSSLPSLKNPKQKEPVIQVRIKPRAKDHPSDDFKIVVNYKVALSPDEQENLKNLVPASPLIKRKAEGYSQLEEIQSESMIEEEEQDNKRNPLAFSLLKKKASEVVMPDHKIISVNLLKNFDQIMVLQDYVRTQYDKNI